MEFEPMLTPREKSPLPENVPRGVSNPRHFGSEPKHYQLSYSGPRKRVINTWGGGGRGGGVREHVKVALSQTPK